jgi:hypothetical protein
VTHKVGYHSLGLVHFALAATTLLVEPGPVLHAAADLLLCAIYLWIARQTIQPTDAEASLSPKSDTLPNISPDIAPDHPLPMESETAAADGRDQTTDAIIDDSYDPHSS